MRRRPSTAEPKGPRYRQIFERLSRDILAGKYQPGQKLPSEAALVRQFAASRITVGRAVRELKERGLVERIAGSGTYVSRRPGEGQLFGLLIPDLGLTEIFEPICQGMAGAPEATQYDLLWGHAEVAGASREEQALKLCQQYLERKVAGVFFAPLERTPAKDEVNLAIVTALEKARIPIVMLDRCVMPFPGRSRHDLVGIDNRRAGYLITEHLIHLGCTRIVFVAYSHGASTVEARLAGYRDALAAQGIPLSDHSVQRLDTVTEPLVKQMLDTTEPEALVCVNDRTAGQLMQAVMALGYRVPADLRIAGIDDVEYARMLPVPLTTIHQPCREIGQAAMAAMLDRLRHPEMLPRDILLECTLVVRESCGARQQR